MPQSRIRVFQRNASGVPYAVGSAHEDDVDMNDWGVELRGSEGQATFYPWASIAWLEESVCRCVECVKGEA